MRFSLVWSREVGGHGEGSRQEIMKESARKWPSELAEQEKKIHIYSLSNNILFHKFSVLLVIVNFLLFFLCSTVCTLGSNHEAIFSLFTATNYFIHLPSKGSKKHSALATKPLASHVAGVKEPWPSKRSRVGGQRSR